MRLDTSLIYQAIRVFASFDLRCAVSWLQTKIKIKISISIAVAFLSNLRCNLRDEHFMFVIAINDSAGQITVA